MRVRTSTVARIEGMATPAGTARYRQRVSERFGSDFFRSIADRVLASSIGLGTYLGECDDADDARYSAAALFALERGINVLDTAINYRCQRSERVLGEVLREALASEIVRRDEVVLCTKGGYIPLDGEPPATREEYQAYLKRHFLDSGVMTPADIVAGGHCLAPTYLAHQITRSRSNLGVRTIDLYYLHNPEQQLDAIERDQFRTRMRDAFVLLEERVATGDIVRYGCATWKGLRVPPNARSHLSLADLMDIAREAGGDGHHFTTVQLPINLAMTEAVRAPTQRLGKHVVPLLQAATELGVSVVASATLMQAQLTRQLPAELHAAFPNLGSDAQRAIAFVRALPGVTTALVGMKTLAHVEENLEAGMI